jgi:hypothetical protein
LVKFIEKIAKKAADILPQKLNLFEYLHTGFGCYLEEYIPLKVDDAKHDAEWREGG